MRLTTFLSGLALALTTGTLQAVPVTYDFTVAATSGPLSGVTSSGYFTYDDNIAPPGGGLVEAVGLLTDLNFEWDSVDYDETSANTGMLDFGLDGSLVGYAFGNNCRAGACIIVIGGVGTTWSVSNDQFFRYSIGRNRGDGSVALQAPAIPEPGALALIGIGLAGLAFGRLRKQ